MSEINKKLETVTEHPFNAATPLSVLSDARTPNPLTYVRNHFSIPDLNETSWRLKLGGEFDQPREYTLAELQDLPIRTIPLTLECAGNGRKSMDPQPKGTPWDYGAVSVIEVTGTSLLNLLETVGLRDNVVELSFHGADEGEVEPGRSVSYVRSLPLELALHPDTMLVWAMNGETLTPEHGYPLRLHVPGWYGMAAVKWLEEIRALPEPFEGFFQSEHYVYREEVGTPEAEPVREMRVRSLITYPEHGASLENGRIEILGMAWSGKGEITRVEVSTDGGATWVTAHLDRPESEYVPSVWTHQWTPVEPGSYTLLSRATDSAGDIQPLEQRWNKGGYGNNGVQAVEVSAF
jgi:DMSO/TMAO reductase YedYZ molybdopterin-dependent catalytic subunit